MLRGSDDRAALAAQVQRGCGTSPSGAMRRSASAAVPDEPHRVAGGERRLSASTRTASPSRSMTVAVTSSVRLRTNDARARSKRPSRLGEKNGVAVSSCTRGGVLLSSCAAKNAANVAQTSSANAIRAKRAHRMLAARGVSLPVSHEQTSSRRGALP